MNAWKRLVTYLSPLVILLVALQLPTKSSLSLSGAFTHVQSCLAARASPLPRIISFDPLIIYFEDFVSAYERNGIIAYARTRLERSRLLLHDGSFAYSEKRTSSSALVPRNQTHLAIVLKRYVDIQGYVDTDKIENVQVTHYDEGQEFKAHYDFQPNASHIDTMRFRRATTGFVVLDADCDDCGTRFPLIQTNWTRASDQWCRIVDCTASTLIVKPIPGSLLYWQNVRSDGKVDKRMLHAGMPLRRGHKTGLNIWTDLNLWDTPVSSRSK